MVNRVQETYNCSQNAIQRKKTQIYEGVLIKESIEDEMIIDLINVHKIELWNTRGKPKYWTVLFFTSNTKEFPERVSKVMKSGSGKGENWFVDFKKGNEKYIFLKIKS